MLRNLEESLLRMRPHSRSGSTLHEAKRCYDQGAYRGAIVIAWLAVVQDFLEKLQVLSSEGNSQAEMLARAYHEAQQKQDYKVCLEFENKLPTVARQFQYVDSIGSEALERLRLDRHKCAHPAVLGEGDLFAPSAELARLHLFVALEYMLLLEPLTGAPARAKIEQTVESAYFPFEDHEAQLRLNHTPLRTGQPALIRWFVKWCLFKTLRENVSDTYLSALRACLAMHPVPGRDALAEFLSDALRLEPEDQLDVALCVILDIPGAWTAVSADQQSRIRTWIETDADATMVGLAAEIPELLSSIQGRLKGMSIAELGEAAKEVQHPIFLADAMRRYESCSAFDDANQLADTVLHHFVESLTQVDFDQLAKIGSKNLQVEQSFGFQRLNSKIYAVNPSIDLVAMVAELKSKEVALDA